MAIWDDFGAFHAQRKKAAEDEETENAFVCPLSQHEDGNHSKSWFDGGTCAWCHKT